LLVAGLGYSRSIGSASDQRISSWEERSPLPCPCYPGILRKWRLQGRRVPCCACIGADFDLLYATIPRKSNTANFNRLSERYLLTRTINTSCGVEGSIVPALIRIETADSMIA